MDTARMPLVLLTGTVTCLCCNLANVLHFIQRDSEAVVSYVTVKNGYSYSCSNSIWHA
jgi:hypothetical protein